MRCDNVAQEILRDIIIISWGEDLVKQKPNNTCKYHLSAKMRRCVNFLIEMRIINQRYNNMLSCMKPDAFVAARTFKSASTGLQFGAYLKQMASLGMKLILCNLTNDTDMPLSDLRAFKRNVDVLGRQKWQALQKRIWKKASK